MTNEQSSSPDTYGQLRRRYTVALDSTRVGLRASNRTQREALRTRARIRVSRLPRENNGAATCTSDGELERLKVELEDMRRALSTRDLIWSAKTIIASMTGAGPDEAHRLLVRQSQHENRKLREVAADIVGRHKREAS